MTKREMFNAIANVAEVASNEEMMKFINHEIELLDSRKGKSKGMTKTQKENEGIKDLVAMTLAVAGQPMTVTEILHCDGLDGFTNQKISALLRQMVASGKVVKTIEGKKAYFSAVEA